MTKYVQKHKKNKCYAHVVAICCTKTNSCEEKLASYGRRVKDGGAKRKLGLIAGCALAEHLSPPVPLFEQIYSFSAGSPSYNNEFP